MTTEQTPQATEYVILESVGDGWHVSGAPVTATNNTAAIRQHLAGKAEVDASFVAVPSRSWRPVSVRSKVALDFGEAS